MTVLATEAPATIENFVGESVNEVFISLLGLRSPS